ncbi:MAG: hypothetical protein M1829_002436 [Trizodia sp. TS-e1964]|nr:MAG: hypothetical protein M1829_002436 [Trizodia sp. TS-e1964]
MESVNIPELVERLGSDEDAVRKMAVFKLQSSIGDPSFADVFISEGGLIKLRFLALHATGNTLAYSLTSFSRLLEVDKGWDHVSPDLVERVVELVVTHPLVNILRGAMSILVAVVSRPHTTLNSDHQQLKNNLFGFRALKPAIAIHPSFFEMVVSQLSSADHALCANALQLINSLMRDTITNESDAEWPKFIKRLQDLGVIKAVYPQVLMQSTFLQDLAHPALEFQALTKLLLRKWREVRVDLEKPEHRRALKSIHLASSPDRSAPDLATVSDTDDAKRSRRHSPEKWRRLGFETESPGTEFEEAGFLGMMDLTDYIRKHEDSFQKLLLEQSTKTPEKRCPVARASLALTLILFHHFDIERSAEKDESKVYHTIDSSRTNFERIFKPLLLQWSRIHSAGLQAFFRIWKATGAEIDDFHKIADLLRILLEQVVGSASRMKDVLETEAELAEFECSRLRELQMEMVEREYEDMWGQHLRQVREELHHEALQFVKEQRIRCLLQGAWFPIIHLVQDDSEAAPKSDVKRQIPLPWRYVRLSHNRRYLHYADFSAKGDYEPGLDVLGEKVDLSTVSSVVSNVISASAHHSTTPLTISSSAAADIHHPPALPSNSSTSTLRTLSHLNKVSNTTNKITIHGYFPSSETPEKEHVFLTLSPPSHTLASEWLDGLLMLLNQQPITAETTKLITLVRNYGLKIRLLNVRFNDISSGGRGYSGNTPPVPSREDLDEDYYYSVFGGT